MNNLVKGLIIGLAVGYLTAPKSGKKTRQELVGKKDGLKDFWGDAQVKLKEYVDDLKTQAGLTVDRAEDKYDQYKRDAKSTKNELLDRAENKFDQYKHEAHDAQNDAKDKYNSGVDQLADAAKSGVNKAESNLKV